MKELEIFAPYVVKSELVGSTAINGKGEDIDIALRVTEGDKDTLRQLCIGQGYEEGGSGEEADEQFDFKSYKKGKYNLLFCYDDESYDRFVKGARACVILKNLGVDMTDKRIRVAVHALVCGEPEETLVKALDAIGEPKRAPVAVDPWAAFDAIVMQEVVRPAIEARAVFPEQGENLQAWQRLRRNMANNRIVGRW